MKLTKQELLTILEDLTFTYETSTLTWYSTPEGVLTYEEEKELVRKINSRKELIGKVNKVLETL